jgi:hypothetical protein
LWLLGIENRLLLFSTGAQPRILWRGQPDNVHVEATRQLLVASCRLTGGQWQLPSAVKPDSIRLTASLVAGYTAYFAPLLSLLSRASGSQPAIAN